MAALEAVRRALLDHRIPALSAEITRIPQNTLGLETAPALKEIKLMEALEDHEDVQKVWSDLDIPEDILSKMGG
jgi:transcriptional/translational regulatory protein YebC/TACO1